MRVLLDTSTFLWMDASEDKLSTNAHSILEDETTTIYLSHISIWEIQIKSQLSKLQLRVPLPQLIREQTVKNNILLLQLTDSHIYGLSQLPHHHRDPFDRLLISQAITEDITFITKDTHILKYDVNTLW
jgi:PIN domain nuclease of toxin-antitoxin system